MANQTWTHTSIQTELDRLYFERDYCINKGFDYTRIQERIDLLELVLEGDGE